MVLIFASSGLRQSHQEKIGLDAKAIGFQNIGIKGSRCSILRTEAREWLDWCFHKNIAGKLQMLCGRAGSLPVKRVARIFGANQMKLKAEIVGFVPAPVTRSR